jgi:DNA-binding IscR family transcriptional regulator
MENIDEVLTISRSIGKFFNEHPDDKVSRRTLAALNFTADRTMRQAVSELRAQGHLIVADEGGGYRLATSSQDVRRYTASLRSRIIALAKVVKAMETAAVKQFGDFEQLPLWIE